MRIRILTALGALVSAAVHLILWWFLDVRDTDVVGPAFLVNGIAGIVIAALLLRSTHWLPALLVTGFGASTLGAFIISTTPGGLFGVHEQWRGGWVLTAAIAEVVCIVGGLVLLRQALGQRSAHSSVARSSAVRPQ